MFLWFLFCVFSSSFSLLTWDFASSLNYLYHLPTALQSHNLTVFHLLFQLCQSFFLTLSNVFPSHLIFINYSIDLSPHRVVTSELTFYFNHLDSLGLNGLVTQEQFTQGLWPPRWTFFFYLSESWLTLSSLSYPIVFSLPPVFLLLMILTLHLSPLSYLSHPPTFMFLSCHCSYALPAFLFLLLSLILFLVTVLLHVCIFTHHLYLLSPPPAIQEDQKCKEFM